MSGTTKINGHNVLIMNDKYRFMWLHQWMMYYNNKIDIDELCKRLRRLDKLTNKDSKYFIKGGE